MPLRIRLRIDFFGSSATPYSGFSAGWYSGGFREPVIAIDFLIGIGERRIY